MFPGTRIQHEAKQHSKPRISVLLLLYVRQGDNKHIVFMYFSICFSFIFRFFLSFNAYYELVPGRNVTFHLHLFAPWFGFGELEHELGMFVRHEVMLKHNDGLFLVPCG